jgi:hypothetical protein
MAQAIKSALPSHLKSPLSSGGKDDNDATGRHHGKTRSHMVSCPELLFLCYGLYALYSLHVMGK